MGVEDQIDSFRSREHNYKIFFLVKYIHKNVIEAQPCIFHVISTVLILSSFEQKIIITVLILISVTDGLN